MPLKVAVSSGIYYAARAEELANAIRKLGYTLTRGVGAVELAADVAHEVPYSHGTEIRHMAKKQGIDVMLHGDLTVPFCIPERGEWRDAHDRVTKSIRSAVHSGSKYVNFHACLNIWLELMTYAGRKLTMSFCDHEGNFISKILKEDEKLREWFIKESWDDYIRDILTADELEKASASTSVEAENFRRQETERVLTEELKKEGLDSDDIDSIVGSMLTAGIFRLPRELRNIPRFIALKKKVDKLMDGIRFRASKRHAEISEKNYKTIIREKFKRGGRWKSEELRAVVGIIDGYHIMGHYMFYTRDKQWVEMVKQYKDLMDRYKLDYSDKEWLDNAWKKAEQENDREFKEFFYAAIGAKYLEGHIKRALEWMKNEFIPKEIADIHDKRDREELTKIAKNLIIAIETPDAREPSHAGLYFLFRPKQMYAAVKTIREVLNTDKVMIIIDHEHIATQGLDALEESNKTIKPIKDFGELTICVHSNHPNPLQPHAPIEIGDVLVYELLYNLRTTGLGKNRTAYLLFERGGGEDPFLAAVRTGNLNDGHGIHYKRTV